MAKSSKKPKAVRVKRKVISNKKKVEKAEALKTLGTSFNRLISNEMTLFSRGVMTSLLNVGKDINYECGYPDTITTQNYKDMFDREGIPERVVRLMPEESWAMIPKVFETEESEETEFEKEWKILVENKNIYQYLQRIDILSGIGQFGVLLIGLDDGATELREPVEGVEEAYKSGEAILEQTISNKDRKILYLRPFDESVVKILTVERETSSPRYGYPVTYSIEFEDTTTKQAKKTIVVHWTRILHVADNREVSETHGKPRMKAVYNRLLDIRKILSGSGEMFWKGAFPGYAFEVDKEVTLTDDQKTALKKEFEDYQQGLQRYMALGGVTAKSLVPQATDPSPHIEAQLRNIAITLGIPYRVFIGSEQAQLASGQDMRTWNKRVAKRQNGYLTNQVLKTFIDLLIVYGVLPKPKEYFVEWDDLNAPADEDAAKVALVKTDALAKYVAGDVEQIIPPKEYFMEILGMDEDEAEALVQAADDHVGEMDKKDEAQAEADRQREDDVAASEQGNKVELETIRQSS